MAITTINESITYQSLPRDFVKSAGGTMVASRPHSYWTIGGQPAAGVSSSGLTGEVLTSPVTGQINYVNALSGNTYLSRLQAQSTVGGTLLLCDRLWQNSAIDATVTTEQTFTSSLQIPARDDTGTTTGEGVYAAAEVLTGTMSVGTPTLTFKYTNTAGTGGQTSTNLVPTTTATSVGDFFPFGLASGDTGVQKAQSLTLNTTWTGGTLGVVLYRIIARLELPAAQTPNAIDALTGGFNRIYDGTVPFLVFIPSSTTSSNIMGHVIWCQH